MAEEYDLRSEARRALQEGPSSSVKQTGAITAGAVGIAAFLATGLHYTNSFTSHTLAVMVLFIASLPIPTFFILEFFRVRRFKGYLEKVLDSERYYESLIASTRLERDNCKNRLDELILRDRVLVSLRGEERIDE